MKLFTLLKPYPRVYFIHKCIKHKYMKFGLWIFLKGIRIMKIYHSHTYSPTIKITYKINWSWSLLEGTVSYYCSPRKPNFKKNCLSTGNVILSLIFHIKIVGRSVNCNLWILFILIDVYKKVFREKLVFNRYTIENLCLNRWLGEI